MEKTWKPRAAGILCTISGIIGLIVGIGFILLVLILMGYPPQAPSIDLDLLPLVGYFIAIIIAIVGGQYALKRRSWGWALAGAICALVPVVIPGILAIIFVVKGRREFK